MLPTADELVESALRARYAYSLEIDAARDRFLRLVGCTARQRLSINDEEGERHSYTMGCFTENLLLGVKLAKEFLAKNGHQITDAKVLDGDPHDFRCPLLLSTDNEKYVLKYCNITPWIIAAHLGFIPKELLSKSSQLSRNEGGFGWTIRPWISPASTGNPGDQSHEVGRICALCLYLNVFDIHHENYVITTNGAFPIDLECMLYAVDSTTLSFNVDCIGIVNSRYGASAANGAKHFTEYSSPYNTDAGISILKNSYRVNHILRDCEGNGARLVDFKGAFSEGFLDEMHSLICETDELYEVINGLGWSSRKLFRPTIFYRLIMSELELMGASLAKTIFRGRLKLAGRCSQFPRLPIADWEWDQIKFGNFPIFHIDILSGRILSGHRPTFGKWHISPCEQWKRKVALLNEERILGVLKGMIRRLDGDANAALN